MDSPSNLLSLGLLYLCGLFFVAWWIDRRIAAREASASPRWRVIVYALAIGVYCSTWTFYGAVGSTSRSPWGHAPIYMGPILLFLFGWPLICRVVDLGRRHRVTSIADYFAARFGKRQSLSVLVTAVSLAAVLPYIALQFRALEQLWDLVAGGGATPAGVVPGTTSAGSTADSGLVLAVILAVFTILFGTRRLNGRERHAGLMGAVALSSVVKLIAFLAVALLALSFIGPGAEVSTDGWLRHASVGSALNADFFSRTLVSAFALLCLPRQFHALVVEAPRSGSITAMRVLVPLYLLLFMLLAVPIAIAGDALMAAQASPDMRADSYVQWLPMALESPAVSVLAFLGGVSAAAAMVVVATVALAIMLTNELAVPALIRSTGQGGTAMLSLGHRLRQIRQITIVLILLAAWVVSRRLSALAELTDIGFLSFVAAAQLGPGLVAGLYWRRAHGLAVFAGLAVGICLWFYCMVTPVLFDPGGPLLEQGLLGFSSLRPQALFGWQGDASVTYALLISLGANVALVGGLSVLLKPSRADLRQAVVFLHRESPAAAPDDFELSPVRAGQLRALLPPFLDASRLQQLWRSFEERYEQRLLPADRLPLFAVRDAESELAGVIGATSAAKLIGALKEGRQVDFGELASLVSDAGRQQTFNRELLETTLESMQQGVAVADGELRLVAWNSRYEELFAYPERLLYVGMPVARLFRFNAERGVMGTGGGSVEVEVEKRLRWLRKGAEHRFERRLPDGRVIDIHGVPMSRGGFVTTYSDISDYRELVTELEEARQELEGRVAVGSRSLAESNAQLRKENRLRGDAEGKLRDAIRSKSRFMSATSHDLLQPINAARLFNAALKGKLGAHEDYGPTLENIDRSLGRAEELIAELREIARLDSGAQEPRIAPFAVDALLRELYSQFSPLAAQKGLELRLRSASLWVNSDRSLVYRALQNLLANALKYSRRGVVLVGVRRRLDGAEIQIVDQGPGVAAADRARIFTEFERIASTATGNEEGLGLGLAIVARYALLLDLPLRFESEVGRGSLFSLRLPITEAVIEPSAKVTLPAMNGRLTGVRVLCIDNDTRVREALAAMLGAEGCRVTVVAERHALRQAVSDFRPDVIVADYHLDQGDTGIAALKWSLRGADRNVPCIIATADDGKTVRMAARDAGYRILPKPVNPARLTALIYALASDARTLAV